MSSIPATTEVAAAPDWHSIVEEILCPLCSYNLRGLSENRCPECGFRFNWSDLLDPRRRRHPYLFEHHPEANVWSYMKTVVGACRPREFWTSLHPVQASNARRLVIFWMVGAVFIFGARSIDSVLENFFLFLQIGWMPVVGTGSQWSVWYNYNFAPGPKWGPVLFSPVYAIFVAAIPLAWHGLTLLSLLIFRQTMRRVRVKTAHLMRCIVYSADPAFWTLFAIGQLLCSAGYLFVQSYDRSLLALANYAIWTTWGVWTAWRMYCSLRYYLQFDRPFLTLLASQTIVALAFVNILILRVWR